jgi:Rod binding domain-containing protein
MELPSLPALPVMASPVPETALEPSARRGRADLESVARGFETMFMSLLLKEMRQTLDEDTFFPGDRSDILGGLFDMFMGQHLAQAGGIGLGTLIKRQLAQYSLDPAPAKVPDVASAPRPPRT